MGNERGNYRRAILELVLVTGIFAVVSVFLLRIYLTADHLRGEAVAISTATVRAQGVAEAVKRSGTDFAAAQFGMQGGDGYSILRFGKNWETVSENERYQLVLVETGREDGMLHAVVYVGGATLEDAVLGGNADEEKLLCRLSVAVYGGLE